MSAPSTNSWGAENSSLVLRDQDFTNLDFWKEIPLTQIVPTGNNLTSSDSVAIGGLVVRNEVGERG